MSPHDYDGLLTPPTDPFDEWFDDEHDSNGVKIEEDTDECEEDSFDDVDEM